MKFIGKLFLWFVGEALSGVFSQAIAESVSTNPFIFYPILIVCFALGSVGATCTIFKDELKDLK